MIESLPLVTIVVPSFNEASHIVRASLESIRAQTFTDFECIVVDESTRPELADACRIVCSEDARFTYLHPTERLGLASSLNLAISMARGSLIARFDSDDICMPDRLALQVAFLSAHPEISVVGGALYIMRSDGQMIGRRSYPEGSVKIAKCMQLTNAIAHPTVMFRKVAVEQHGGYNQNFRSAEDLELWLRWMNAGLNFANLPQVLVRYRQDNTNRDQQNWEFNLRARRANFSRHYVLRRAFGIACIAIWSVVPNAAKEQIFKALIFQRRNAGGSK